MNYETTISPTGAATDIEEAFKKIIKGFDLNFFSADRYRLTTNADRIADVLNPKNPGFRDCRYAGIIITETNGDNPIHKTPVDEAVRDAVARIVGLKPNDFGNKQDIEDGTIWEKAHDTTIPGVHVLERRITKPDYGTELTEWVIYRYD